VFAVDFDGTGAQGRTLGPEVASTLSAARAHGHTTILATGRLLEDLHHLKVDMGLFDAVVAENGAVVWLPGRDRLILDAKPPDPALLAGLRKGGIPFHVGAVVVGTWHDYVGGALSIVRELGLDLQLVFNRGAVMLLPSGVNKATGVRRALDELGRSACNMIAFGDAENDLPLLRAAEVGVAVHGSVTSVRMSADELLTRPGPEGVAHLVQAVLDAGGTHPTPARHAIDLGVAIDGRHVLLPAADGNVLVTGDPQSGKSWLAGLLAERLVDAGHRIVVIDPEGDHADIGHHFGALVLGLRMPLPDPVAIPEALEWSRTGLVLDLSGLPSDERRYYAPAALRALTAARERTGLPQWIIVDEAHEALRVDAECVTGAARTSGRLVMVTYRPSLLSKAVLETVVAHVLLRTEDPAERYFLEGWIGSRAPRGIVAREMLEEVRAPYAGLHAIDAGRSSWETFVPARRFTRQVHHGRKYDKTRVPAGREFRFLGAGGSVVAEAHDVEEWRAEVMRISIESLQHHLALHDFSRWFAEVVGDRASAGHLRAIEAEVDGGSIPGRHEIVARTLA